MDEVFVYDKLVLDELLVHYKEVVPVGNLAFKMFFIVVLKVFSLFMSSHIVFNYTVHLVFIWYRLKPNNIWTHLVY